MLEQQFDKVFSGIIGEDYELLKFICPLAAEMSRLVGIEVGKYLPVQETEYLKVVEIGSGTGITSLSMLQERDDLSIVAIDNEPTMQNQARQNLARWVDAGRLTFSGMDALSALQTYKTDSVDIMASAYTLHNFLADYRSEVMRETFRVLKPGGQFINGDRYGLDDISAHTKLIQQEVSGYFSVLTKIKRLDLLGHWIVHLFSDESENHVQRESAALELLRQTGFSEIKLANRLQVNALVTAVKPVRLGQNS